MGHVYSVAACEPGRWGLNCANQCDCRSSVGSCDPVTGQCHCDVGFTGPRCDQSMSNQWYVLQGTQI